MPFVYNTGSPHQYGVWKKSITEGTPNQPLKTVNIKGGANVINRIGITPTAVMTKVTDDELATCNADPAFARHIKNGFIVVTKTEQKSTKTVSKNMEKGDGSAQLTDAKIEKLNPEIKSSANAIKDEEDAKG